MTFLCEAIDINDYIVIKREISSVFRLMAQRYTYVLLLTKAKWSIKEMVCQMSNFVRFSNLSQSWSGIQFFWAESIQSKDNFMPVTLL